LLQNSADPVVEEECRRAAQVVVSNAEKAGIALTLGDQIDADGNLNIDLIRVVLRQRLGPEVDDHWVQVLPEQDGWGARMLAVVLGSLTYCGILIRTGEDPSKIGSGGHWISLRRLAGDGWFDLNSLNASARLIVSADASPEVQAEKLCAALQGYQDNSPHFNVYAITSLKDHRFDSSNQLDVDREVFCSRLLAARQQCHRESEPARLQLSGISMAASRLTDEAGFGHDTNQKVLERLQYTHGLYAARLSDWGKDSGTAEKTQGFRYQPYLEGDSGARITFLRCSASTCHEVGKG